MPRCLHSNGGQVLSNDKSIALIFTLRPAVHLFADIAAAYRAQGLATPESLEDAWEKYKRVEEQAQLEIDLGLWE